MRRTSAGTIATLLVAASLLVGATAAAESEEPETLIRQGIELRKRGDDARAHGYFKRAYELSKTPRTAAQLGLVDQAVGRFGEAETLIAEALASNDPWVQQHRSALEDGLKVCRQHLGGIVVAGAPAGTTWSDADHRAAALPSNGAIWVAPGTATLRFEAPGRQPLTKSVTVAAGDSVSLQVDLSAVTPAPVAAVASPTAAAAAPADANPAGGPAASLAQPATPAPVTESPGRSARIAGIAVAGAGVALGVSGFFVRNVATHKLDTINAAAKSMTTPYDPADGNWETYEHLGVGMLIAGGAAVVAGAVIYIVNAGGHAESSRTQVGFAAVPDPRGGGTFQLRARF
jgi:hypothetical protein